LAYLLLSSWLSRIGKKYFGREVTRYFNYSLYSKKAVGMFKLFKATKENDKKDSLNETNKSNSGSEDSRKNQKVAPKKHGDDGVCCGGCGG